MNRQKSVIFMAITAAMLIAVACFTSNTEESAPIPPTAVPPTATATAIPPTPTPVPLDPIEIDPQENPAGFIDAIPPAEASCITDKLGGRDQTLALLGSTLDSTPLSDEDAAAIDGCVSDETVNAVFTGQLSREAGSLSDATMECIAEQTQGMAAAALFTSEPAFDSAISVLKGVFCLNHEERAEVSASTAAYGFGDFGGIDALECVVNGVGPTGLEDLMGLVSVDGGGYAALGDLLPLMIECGAIDDSTFEELGVTAVQVGCVLAELGEEGLGVLDPSAEAPELSQLGPILGALNKCGIELEGIFESLELPVDPVAEVDPTALPKVEVELKIPEELPDIDLPFTEEQIACLTIELGEEKIAALLAGAVPDLSLFTAFATCKVDLATLLGG